MQATQPMPCTEVNNGYCFLSRDKVVCFELLDLPLDPLFLKLGHGIGPSTRSCLAPPLTKIMCLEINVTSPPETLIRVLFLSQCLPLSPRKGPEKPHDVEITCGEGSADLPPSPRQMLWDGKRGTWLSR